MHRAGVFVAAILLAFALPLHAGTPDDDLAFLQQAYAARQHPDASEWKKRVEARFDSLSAAFDRLIADDRGEEALQFAMPLSYFLASANQQTKALETLSRALALPTARKATLTRAQALYQAGVLVFRAGDNERSRAMNEESLRIANALNAPADQAKALIGLSRVALREHRYAAVKKDAEEAAAIRKKIGDDAGAISAMHMVAAAARMSGDDVRARQIYESTLANYVAAGDNAAAAGERYNLGYVALHLGETEKARSLFAAALSQQIATNSENVIAYCLTGFAAIAAVQKQPERAARLYGSASAILDRLGIKLDPDDQLDWDRYTALARSETSKKMFDDAFAAGRAMSVEAAVRLATA